MAKRCVAEIHKRSNLVMAPTFEQINMGTFRITAAENQDLENRGLPDEILFAIIFGSWDKGMLHLLWTRSPLIRKEVTA